MNQTQSVLEEELALLRGIGDRTKQIRKAPAYNRLRWNMNEDNGRALYVENYAIGDAPVSSRSEERAETVPYDERPRKKYPQGHGDAYGHYLMALKVYYGLIRNQSFEWSPGRSRATIGDESIVVDYFDERKFGQAALGRARTALEVADLTHRRDFVTGQSGILGLTWEVETEQEDSGLPPPTLRWGTADWASRGGQGAYLDWVVGNAMLPDEDENPDDLLGALDRESVEELRDLAEMGDALQTRLDAATAGFNPLGVPRDAIAFDINLRTQVRENRSAFDLLYERATHSLRTTKRVLATSLITKAENVALDREGSQRRRLFEEQEVNLNSRLIELFGTPFPSAIGPGRRYRTGYDGPDLDYYNCIEQSALHEAGRVGRFDWNIPVTHFAEDTMNPAVEEILLTLTADASTICVHAGSEQRRSPGRIQADIRRVLQAAHLLDRTVSEYGSLIDSIKEQQQNITLAENVDAQDIRILEIERDTYQTLSELYRQASARRIRFQRAARWASMAASAIAEKIPKVTGLIAGLSTGTVTDFGAPARGAALLAGAVASEVAMTSAGEQEILALDAARAKELIRLDTSFERVRLQRPLRDESRGIELRALIRQEPLARSELHQRFEDLLQALATYRSTREAAQRLLTERHRLRARAARGFESLRYREMAFRFLRREAVDRYRAQFNIALLDVLMLARQFDFETNYSPEDPAAIASRHLKELVQTRHAWARS